MRNDDTEIFLQSGLLCAAESIQFIHGKGCPLVNIIHSAFSSDVGDLLLVFFESVLHRGS
ncbi:hypothetical protein DPMN_011494 [Dreissena polymorpha]|uniref:Uncharacterized protein n=1 Tax=Dreissena polymorpha TaxID=45954 RepID=A0A9D4S2J5_DREPO|nr:hypothetical protein DPMN_011494 [Dreissena polymorpha]